MTKKKSKAKKKHTDIEHQETLGVIYTTPSLSSALLLKELHGDADFSKMLDQLQDRNEEVISGDLSVAEAMLIDQAHVLQALFNKLATQMNSAEYIKQMEAYGRMALRAQNQCQRTLRTLLEYKNPKRTTFIKQQNNLQINQAQKPEKNINPANKLLEVNHDARLDTGTPQEAGKSNQKVETVGEIHRAED